MGNRLKQISTRVVELLNIPYRQQIGDGYCLPACVQMALAYLGVVRTQEEVARKLGLVEGYGIPASNLTRLHTRRVRVIFQKEGSFADIREWLEQGFPVIAFVVTDQLPYWKDSMPEGYVAQHAVVVVGIEEEYIYLLDPAKSAASIKVPIYDFWLAWDEMELSFAVIAN